MTAPTGELEMLRLPCGHLKLRPTRLTVTIVCHCGSTWLLQRKRGEWCARLTHTDVVDTGAVPS